MGKKISVIIPCYNSSKYLDRCVHSLLNQTIGLNNIELIFVNDASTDDTWEKLQKYERLYSDTIMLINLPQNSRQGTARNIGMHYSTGDYLGFCDSDDYVEPIMYETLYNRIKETNANYVVCQRYEEENEVLQIVGPKTDEVLYLQEEIYRNTICQQRGAYALLQCLYDKAFLQKIDIKFPENLTYEDNYFISILNYYADIVGLVATPLYHYTINPASTIHSVNAVHHLDRLTVEVMKLEELKNRGIFLKYLEDIEVQFIKLYFVNTINLLLTRFDTMPDGIILEMQRKVKHYFPNWHYNFILNHYSSAEVKIISLLIEYPFVVGSKEEVFTALRYIGAKYTGV